MTNMLRRIRNTSVYPIVACSKGGLLRVGYSQEVPADDPRSAEVVRLRQCSWAGDAYPDPADIPPQTPDEPEGEDDSTPEEAPEADAPDADKPTVKASRKTAASKSSKE